MLIRRSCTSAIRMWRLELTQEDAEIMQPTSLELKAKAKATRPSTVDVSSQGSWSEEEASKPWSVIQEEHASLVKGELESQHYRLETVEENSLHMISQQLQVLTQAMMPTASTQKP